MDESNFHERADDLLASLLEAIEMADEDGTVDTELTEGVLTLTLQDGGEFLINKHAPSQQIWLSSPSSGATHYSYTESDDEWQDADGMSFKEAILQELSEHASIDVEF